MVNYIIIMKQKTAEFLGLRKQHFVSLSRIKKSLLILCNVALIVSCGSKEQNNKPIDQKVVSRVEALPYYQEATFTPYWLSNDSDSLIDFHRIPDFTFINQHSDTITQDFYKDKIYITDFFFTVCPGICPAMTKNMNHLQKKFLDDEEVLLLSHSVTPDYDTPAVLKEYAQRMGVNAAKWNLVTGDKELIYNLGRNHYFVEEDLGTTKDVDDFLHTENFILIDKNKRIRGIYNGLNKASVNQLIADVKTLKAE
ncbi:SCO family protein [Nonlabens mediterrranea]|uniref:SCO family protein n=1 Tax=Nonlabens mediterrranea TaxID=1419947 RepID=A0ABS0A1B6_9FLAO|nr:SCO family protein [Nonlabens mediterrranea]